MNGYVLAALLCLIGIAAFTGFEHGVKTATSKERLVAQRAMDAHLTADRKAEADAAAQIKALEQDLILAQDAAGTAYEKGKKDAEQKGKTVVADLRAGNLRLRDHWLGCQAALQQSDHSAPVAESGEAARDREESAGRIVRAAAECDAQVSGLQDAYNAIRDLVNKQANDSSRR